MGQLKLDSLRQDVRKLIEAYLKKQIAIHGDNLISIVLYGSATGKDFIPGSSDVNLLFVFKELDFPQLDASLRLVSAGIQKKIAAPLFLSRTHIETSRDVFPIEFLEMKENNIVLYGEDLFREMRIEQTHTRLFCEQQIKGKLIRLRQAYLEVGLKKKGIEALMKESLYGLMPIFRALLRLKQIVPSVEKEEILNQLAEAFSLDRNVFIAILRDKKNDAKIGGQEVGVYFRRYIAEIRKLAMAVDGL